MIRVVGTAGHVDHGKSALVKALSGIDPDRLKEEKEREMTIDLGFAWVELPSGLVISIIDVPGHEDFVRNMLAGVGGIDAALFVVAADEGVMPQSREHLAILDLLEVRGGIVALSKRDLVDAEWLELVQEEVRELLQGTVLEGAPIVPVSSREGQGLDALGRALDEALTQVAERQDLGRPRLPIDRVFTMTGFGTVVTGTLIDGSLAQGQELEILPRRLEARVRGLQTHGRKVEAAQPGSRVAVNLVGVGRDELRRGDVVSAPRLLTPSRLLDVRVKLLEGAPQELRHNHELILYHGSAEIVARLRLMDERGAVLPGEEVLAQLRLARPTVAVHGDHFILRQPSPPLTVAGGVILDPLPGRRHRRRSPHTVERLGALIGAAPVERLRAALSGNRPRSLAELVQRSGLGWRESAAGARRMAADGEVVLLEGRLEPEAEAGALLAARRAWDAITERAMQLLQDYHRRFPLRSGMPREELHSRLRVSGRVFQRWLELLVAEELLEQQGTVVFRRGHRPEVSPEEQQAVDRLLSRYREAPFSPPSVQEAVEMIGQEAYQLLLEHGHLVQVNAQVVFDAHAYREMVRGIVESLKAGGTVTVATLRDRFDTSRKYSLAVLEHLDQERITRRRGDERVLLRPPAWLS